MDNQNSMCVETKMEEVLATTDTWGDFVSEYGGVCEFLLLCTNVLTSSFSPCTYVQMYWTFTIKGLKNYT